MMTARRKRFAIWLIFLVVLFDTLRFSLAIPILPPLFLNNLSGLFAPSVPFVERSLLLGLLLASYPIAAFVGAPILGTLSDRFGRKPLLLVSYIGTFFALILIALGIKTNLIELLFFGRILDGFTGGNVSVAQSAMADLSEPQEKVRNFALINTAFGLGFIIGPFLGGKISDPSIVSWFDYATPFLLAAIMTFGNILLVMAVFRETLRERIARKVSALTGLRNLKRAWYSPLRTLFIVAFFNILGFNFFNQFMQVSVVKKYGFTQSHIGDVFAYLGICLVLSQLLVVRNLAKKFQPSQLLRVTLIASSLTMFSYALTANPATLYLILPLTALFHSINNPNIVASISNLAGANAQGETLGINQSIQSVAMSMPPILTGLIINFNINGPILASALAIAIAWLIYTLTFSKR